MAAKAILKSARWDEKWEMEEVKVDAKKRVVLPDDVRRKAGVKTGTRLRVTSRDGAIVLMKSISPEEFVKKMEGSLKEGSPVRAADPLRLKEIWTKD
jgi:AbrB family looped-hinge helix DNA binding protein